MAYSSLANSWTGSNRLANFLRKKLNFFHNVNLVYQNMNRKKVNINSFLSLRHCTYSIIGQRKYSKIIFLALRLSQQHLKNLSLAWLFGGVATILKHPMMARKWHLLFHKKYCSFENVFFRQFWLESKKRSLNLAN